jgi:hypothetical protein
MANLIVNLRTLGSSMFIPISPNVNWCNPSNWVRTKQRFRELSQHIHLSANCSDIGKQQSYLATSIIGGTAILTFQSWASKVSQATNDESGFGTFSITTLQGKQNKKISFIAAYIAVQKGSDIGVESLFAQQCTIHEQHHSHSPNNIGYKFYPRQDAIHRLNNKIEEFQKANHAIILMIDANQTVDECYCGSKLKPYMIEWLRLQRGLDDPFITLMGSRPNSTTQNPLRPVDFSSHLELLQNLYRHYL